MIQIDIQTSSNKDILLLSVRSYYTVKNVLTNIKVKINYIYIYI